MKSVWKFLEKEQRCGGKIKKGAEWERGSKHAYTAKPSGSGRGRNTVKRIKAEGDLKQKKLAQPQKRNHFGMY